MTPTINEINLRRLITSLPKHALSLLLAVVFLGGAIGLTSPTESQGQAGRRGSAVARCGPRTQHERFVVSRDGTEVCDNTTGLRWEQRPVEDILEWEEAMDYCAALPLNGKEWRLPEVYELLGLIDWSGETADEVFNPGPFDNIQLDTYYISATTIPEDLSSEVAEDYAEAEDEFLGAWGVERAPAVFRDVLCLGPAGHVWCVHGGPK